jgi:hypothetical protein
MMGKWLSGVLLGTLLGATGCCSWCKRHCPQTTAYQPAPAYPAQPCGCYPAGPVPVTTSAPPPPAQLPPGTNWGQPRTTCTCTCQ